MCTGLEHGYLTIRETWVYARNLFVLCPTEPEGLIVENGLIASISKGER
jgi:hypothetical protein